MRQTTIIHAQRGLGIVEILIASALSLVALLAMFQVLASSKSSSRLNEGMARLQENARFALDVLARDIRRAGFPSSEPTVTAFITSGTTPPAIANGSSTASDVITIQYQPNDNRDCLGNPLPTGTTLTTNAYYVLNGQLVCQGSSNTTPGVVADFVDNMQVLYGVDQSSPADGTADIYVRSTRVTSVGNWDQVSSVRIALLVNSDTEVLSSTNTNTYSLLDVSSVGPFGDRRVRQVFNTTIWVRNQTPL
jgi:type IV pilus assembly protein PilW